MIHHVRKQSLIWTELEPSCYQEVIHSPLALDGVSQDGVGEDKARERTLSLSCSDKIIKWNIVGLQGALCSYFLSRDLQLHSFVLTGNMVNNPVLERALYGWARVDPVNIPTLDNVVIEFEFCKSEDRPSPCPDSVVWVDGLSGGESWGSHWGSQERVWARKEMTNPKCWAILCQKNIVIRVLELGESNLVGLSKT